jgi:hypothetical protein
MGILFDDHAKDVQAIHRILSACLTDWNDRFAQVEGVVLGLNEESVEVASSVGGKILGEHFLPQPDAYKRVAALLVMMCLHPFIIGRKRNADGMFVEVLQGELLRYFGIINAVDSIGALFDPLEQLNDQGQWVQMDKWPGFPSYDARADLIQLLYSYSGSGVLQLKELHVEYNTLLLYQTILSTSLILKQGYPV